MMIDSTRFREIVFENVERLEKPAFLPDYFAAADVLENKAVETAGLPYREAVEKMFNTFADAHPWQLVSRSIQATVVTRQEHQWDYANYLATYFSCLLGQDKLRSTAIKGFLCGLFHLAKRFDDYVTKISPLMRTQTQDQDCCLSFNKNLSDSICRLFNFESDNAELGHTLCADDAWTGDFSNAVKAWGKPPDIPAIQQNRERCLVEIYKNLAQFPLQGIFRLEFERRVLTPFNYVMFSLIPPQQQTKYLLEWWYWKPGKPYEPSIFQKD